MTEKIIRTARPSFIIAVFILVFLGKKVIPAQGGFIGGFDVAKYFFWHAHFIKTQFLSGSVPLWNPYYYCGHPFLANPQAFVWYPTTLLFVVLPLPWAFNLDTVLHLYLAALGMYSFIFYLTESRTAGLAAAIVYSLNSYFVDNIVAGHLTMLHTAALLPWIFYLTERAYRAKQPILFATAGLVLGLQILGGEPQNTYYTCLFLTVYYFLRHFLSPRNLRFEPFHHCLLYFFIIPAVALGIGAVQILPSLEFLHFCDRSQNTYEFATFMSFPPRNFFTFLVAKPQTPRINTNWEYSGYFGIFSIILAGVGCITAKQRHHKWSFGIMLSIAMTVMLGFHTPLYQFYYKWLIGIATFRIPARCILIVILCVAVYVGLGVEYLCKSRLSTKNYSILLIGSAFLFFCLLRGSHFFHIDVTSKEVLLSITLFIIAFLFLIFIRFQKNIFFVSILLVIVPFVDLYLTNSSAIPIVSKNQLLQKRHYEDIFENDQGFYRINLSTGRMRGMRFNYFGINGYTPIALKNYYNFVHAIANVPESLRRNTLSPTLSRPDFAFSSKILGVKYAMDGEELLTAARVMPRATLVRDAVVLPQLEDHIAYIKKADFDPEQEVLLVSPPPENQFPLSQKNPRPRTNDVVSITKYRPNRIELRAESENNSYLVLSELYYPGWHAYVDGKEVPILLVDYILRAIPLTPGKHEISFLYRPLSFILGAIITLLFALLLGCVYFLKYLGRMNIH
jgi:hypothetical protein